MNDVTYRDYRIDDPIVFRAPSPEIMAELRRLLPPVEPNNRRGEETRPTPG